MSAMKLADLKQLSGDVRQQLEIRGSLKGYNDFKKQLKDFDPDLRKAMDREIRALLKPVVSNARNLVPSQPLSGWRIGNGRTGERGGARLPDWDQSTVRKGIVLRQGGKRSRGSSTQSAWKLQNKSAAGEVFEIAAKQRTKPSGRIFTSALTLYHGKTSRLIWRAWDESGGSKKITRDVTAVVRTYEGILERNLRAAKG
jgi:hypothetical protein